MPSVSPLWLLIIACSLSGCRIFHDAPTEAADKDKSQLPPIAAVPEAIELEIGHIRGLANDPLLGDALWNDINQVIAGSDERSWQHIHDNGFRVGVAAAQPPDSLVKLLNPGTDTSSSAGSAVQTSLQSVVIRDGTPTEVTASPYFQHCRIAESDGTATTYREFEVAQGKYQITVNKPQDGWVVLDFVPLMYHADEKTRRTATPAGTFALQHGQKRKVFYSNRFQVRVMVGEWVVIGGNPRQPGTLGHQFYFGPETDDQQLQEYRRRTQQTEGDGDDNAAETVAQSPAPSGTGEFQRLLVIRIANMKQATVR